MRGAWLAAACSPATPCRTRRLAAGPARGARIDLRRTLRRSIGEGGGIIDLARRGPKTKHPPLVVLCDISGSMSQYTRVMPAFHPCADAMNRRSVHAFTFGTRLTNISRALRKARDRRRSPWRQASAQASTTGRAARASPRRLHAFNKLLVAPRARPAAPSFCLITDGLDRDGCGLVSLREADRLHTFLLAASSGSTRCLRYDVPPSPRPRASAALLPHVDEFRAGPQHRRGGRSRRGSRFPPARSRSRSAALAEGGVRAGRTSSMRTSPWQAAPDHPIS